MFFSSQLDEDALACVLRAYILLQRCHDVEDAFARLVVRPFVEEHFTRVRAVFNIFFLTCIYDFNDAGKARWTRARQLRRCCDPV